MMASGIEVLCSDVIEFDNNQLQYMNSSLVLSKIDLIGCFDDLSISDEEYQKFEGIFI